MRCRKPVVLASIAAVSLLAAGCGGGHSPGVANVATSTTTSSTASQSGAFAFARCMRSHGVPNWPDPDSSGVFDKSKIRQLGVSGPRMRAIEDRSCGHLLPQRGGTQQETPQQARIKLADELSFARCMRTHGVSRFPDPTPQDGLSVEIVQAHGIDVHSPAVLRVVQACLPASHGALTAAKVRQALAEAHR